MYCGKCGKQIPDGSKFCPICGEKIVVAEPINRQPTANQQPPMQNVQPTPTADYNMPPVQNIPPQQPRYQTPPIQQNYQPAYQMPPAQQPMYASVQRKTKSKVTTVSVIFTLLHIASLVAAIVLMHKDIFELTTGLDGLGNMLGVSIPEKYLTLADQKIFDVLAPIISVVLTALFVLGIILSLVSLIARKPVGCVVAGLADIAPVLSLILFAFDFIYGSSQVSGYESYGMGFKIMTAGVFLLLCLLAAIVSSIVLGVEGNRAKNENRYSNQNNGGY